MSDVKIEIDVEACCVCRGTGELLTPEEYDSGAPPMQTPLRTILLSLNNNKVIPDGRYCNNCIRRAIEAQEFSNALATRGPPPLSEKIRALRRRLHELTQKIDVFIVVGGPGADTGGAYSEDDIILVEKDTLAAAVTADDEDLERARNARGDTVYQCSVCPISFERVSEYRDHMNLHPTDAVHCCWTCGAQFPNRSALRDHADQHSESHALHCYLCNTNFMSHFEMRRHEPQCTARCPACSDVYPDRASLSNHVAANHERGAGPLVCSACFLSFESSDLLSAHMLRHRQAKQYVCGYDGCILRFGNRNNLMSHIRKVHGGEVVEAPEEPPPQPKPQSKGALVPCEHCKRQFASVPAMKRHLRVHRPNRREPQPEIVKEEIVTDMQMMEGDEDLEGEVEYLEVETLEDMEDGQEYD